MKKIVSLCLAAVMTLAAFTLVIPSERAFAANDITADFAKYQNGVVDRKNNAAVSTHSHGGVNCAMVIPKPTASDASRPINIDSYSWGNLVVNGSATTVPLNSLKYIVIKYRYDGQTETLGRPMLRILPNGDKGLTSSVSVYSYEEKLTCNTGSWQTLTFDFEGAFDGKTLTNVNLRQMHFYPYGEVAASVLDEFEMFHFSEITFGYGVPENKRYPVLFEKGFYKAYLPDGVSNGNTTVAAGESIVLPDSPYVRDGFEFDGWISWHGNKKYQVGDTVTVNSKEIFTADWKHSSLAGVNDFVVADIGKYCFGRINGGKGEVNHGIYTKGESFDGVDNLYKFKPDTSIAAAGAKIDSWNYNELCVDIKDYHHLAIVYYYKSNNPAKAKWQQSFLTNGGIAKSNSIFYDEMTANRWAVINIDFTSFSDKATETADGRNYLRQMHINPFSDVKMSDLDPDDELYIGKLVFSKNQFEFDVTDAIFAPEADSSIRPAKLVTRGEACAAIIRAAGLENDALDLDGESSYADVTSENKYNKYILLLENLGVLNPEEGESFRPGSPVTKAELAELAVAVAVSADGASLETVGALAVTGSSEYVTRGALAETVSTYTGNNLPRGIVSGVSLQSFTDVNPYSADASVWALLGVRGITVPNKGMYISPLVSNNTGYAVDEVLYAQGNDYIRLLDVTTTNRIAEIRSTGNEYYDKYLESPKTFGNVIFVSENGSDTNDGKTPETAIKTLKKLGSMGSELAVGDAVFFERGGVYREDGVYQTVAGVTYSSYGEGAKPEIWGSHFDLTKKGSWELYTYTSDGGSIWKYSDDIGDCGALFLMKDGEVVTVAAKEIPSYFQEYLYTTDVGSEGHTAWRTRADKDTPFIVAKELDNDLEYVNLVDSSLSYLKQTTINGETVTLRVPNLGSAVGVLYFRCDAGNPAVVYDEIEYAARHNGFAAKSGVTVDNLAIKFVGNHGIGAGTVTDLTVTNCEIGWIGGAIQHYNTSNANAGRVTRFGNGVEIYGGLYNYTIDNCYVYEAYDAGVTHQYSSGGTANVYMENVDYTNNVFEYCTYNIEYFAGSAADGSDATRKMKDILFENNIIRLAGYGWGQQRPDPAPAAIKGWTHNNLTDGFVIRNNIIDRSTHMLMQVGTAYASSAPYLVGNTYVQHCGNDYAYYYSSYLGKKATFKYDGNIEETMRLMDEDNATVYFTDPIKWEHIYVYHRNNVPGTYN